jgi:predicted nucleotide-binding protein
MKKKKDYPWTKFSPDTIRKASALFEKLTNPDKQKEVTLYLVANVNDEQWTHDSEDEFFPDYRQGPPSNATYCKYIWTKIDEVKKIEEGKLWLYLYNGKTSIEVSAKERPHIQAVFEIFEAHLSESRLPEPQTPPPKPLPSPIIFIGHGHNTMWRELKDHLQDKHNYRVEAYEVGARAGHVIRNILEEMLTRSSLAFLILTAEDETAEGGMRARQNVIHELGLFQGKLGFSRAIILLEEGTEQFSNIQGIEQIRFSKGNIRETFGEVLATIRRELSSK